MKDFEFILNFIFYITLFGNTIGLLLYINKKEKEEKEKPKKLTFFDEVREKHTEIQDNSDDEVKDLIFVLLDEYIKK